MDLRLSLYQYTWGTFELVIPEMANGSNVCLLPSDLVERTPALREVLWDILGWDKDAVVAVERFTNALSNHVFMVTKGGDSPESVVVRVFGSADGSALDSVRVYELLSAAGITPASLGRFLNGRVEAYLQGFAVIDSLPMMRQYAEGIAQELARFHVLATRALGEGRAPVESLCGRLRRWRDEVEALGMELPDWVREGLLKVDVEGVIGSIGGFEEQAVLHGDLQAGNIMVTTDLPSWSSGVRSGVRSDVRSGVRFIDVEYLCRGPVSFDLSNHFLEWSWSGDYSVLDYREERWPDLAERHSFVAAYAGARGWSSGAVDRLLAEVDVCVRVSHLHWALWGVLEGARRQESAGWDYLGYAKGRYGRLLSGSTRWVESGV